MLLVVFALLVLGLAASSSATVDEPPTITGAPVIGQTLTSSSADFHKWQRCDPSTTSCTDTAPGWTNIPGASGGDARSYTLAAADLGFLIRVLTKGSHHEFLVSTPVGPVTAPPAPPQAIAPQHGVQLIGVPVGGTVTYKAPGQSAFAPLDTTKPIPVDSLIDARGGRVRLTAATGVLGDRTPDQSIEFYGGLFKIQQSAATNSVAIARLVGKLSCGSAASGKASASGPQAISAKRRGKRLWGSGSGSYATAGRGGTGSVRGTTWLTKETCQGTFFKVADEPGPHGIDVNAKGKKKPVFLGPGDSYLAER